MKKTDLKRFEKIKKVTMHYIKDNASRCLDLIQSEEVVDNVLKEINKYPILNNLEFLSKLEKDSLEYLYARYSWAMEVIESNKFKTSNEFYKRVEEVFDVKKENLPKCIIEAVSSLENKKLTEEIYEVGNMIVDYNLDRIKFLEFLPTDLKDLNTLLADELTEEDFKRLSLSKDSTLKTFTVKFNKNIEADIKVCSGDNNCFVDPVLFDDGQEVCTLDCEGEFSHGQEFEFECDNVDYTVVVYDRLHDFKTDIVNALGKYDSDNLYIVNDEDSFTAYITYHSDNNSFQVGKRQINYSHYSEEEKDKLFNNLLDLANEFDLGTVAL